ncbi:hypothetical protein, partial [Actinomadura sp. DC4]|uniref:hypothetical protein n=1 Tax=Actinomadura sp. DC4 TaxID=3055069 RepID=UPI0025B13334
DRSDGAPELDLPSDQPHGIADTNHEHRPACRPTRPTFMDRALADLASATEDVQQAIEEVGKPLPEEESERAAIYRARIERLVQDAAAWGAKLGSGRKDRAPRLTIEWEGDQPHLRMPRLH